MLGVTTYQLGQKTSVKLELPELTFPKILPRFPFTDQPEWEKEHLGKLIANWHGHEMKNIKKRLADTWLGALNKEHNWYSYFLFQSALTFAPA